MASRESAVQILYKENNKADFLAASELLLRLATNVIENPQESKYRRIRLANPLLETKLLPVIGGMECLFEMGFQEDGEYLTLPLNGSLNVVRQVRDELYTYRSKVETSNDAQSGSNLNAGACTGSVASGSASQGAAGGSAQQDSGSTALSQGTPGAAAATVSPPSTSTPLSHTQPTQTVQDLRRKEADFLRRLQSSMAHVLLYEDPNLQRKARAIIPLDTLKENAEARLRSPNPPFAGERPPGDFNDSLLLELLDWFKKSFFSWVDSPACETCGGNTHHAGSASPTSAELTWGGSRVENHQCDTCGALTRFVRYNHPGKLLDTRRGRCGEWANCFTLCCRALGFEARYVLDWTDHVWTEVYSASQRRWLHCDPCENTCDKPLLYEQGWGKKLTYVLAFSKDEAQDVTWRYSAKHAELLSRRRECREAWLVQVVHHLCRQKLQAMSEARKGEMQQRLIAELVELITVKSSVRQSLPGRTTGSLAWRQGRGETGDAAAAAAATSVGYTFRLLQEEKHSEVVHIKYSCAQDVYVRASANEIRIKRWYTCAGSQGVFRKEESDWKMAYLAREEGADTGQVSWTFDLSGEDLRINKLEVKGPSQVYEDGAIDWRICCDSQCFSVAGGQLQTFKTFELEGGQILTVTAILRGGRGDNAWQHAQLFRQSLDDSDFPFEVILHLG